jgi:hypothetical protein
MSLQHAAKHLASKGRGPDTELIHMTKGEINSLQTLAKANGGSLTINPHTGLPEAGFLKNMLPMIAGAAAMYFTGGAAAPLIGGLSNAATIGLGIGGLETARTGSLQKGLMAGLGAYGGAGLAGGLMAAGTSGATSAIGASAEKAGEEAAKNAAAQHAAQEAAATEAAKLGAPGIYSNPAISSEVMQQSAREAAANAYLPTAAESAALNSPLTTGISGLGTEAGRSAFGNAVINGGSTVGKLGLAAAAPIVGSALTKTRSAIEGDKSDGVMPQRLVYNPGTTNPATNTITPPPQPDVPGYGNLGQDFGKQQNYFPYAGYQNITA